MKTHLTRLLLAALLAASVAGPLTLSAQTSMVPDAMTYQGVLTDTNGDVVAPSAPENRILQFRIYNAATGGTVLWGEEQSVTVFKGNFSVILGNGSAIGAPSGAAAFAAVFTNATTSTLFFGITPQAGVEFAPRQQLLSSAYALRAKQAESVNATAQAANTPSQFNAVTANAVTVSGRTRISGANVLEFGSGVSGKEVNAGSIGYGAFNANSLDIIGAGNSVGARSITLIAEGGTNLSSGPLNFGARLGQHINLYGTTHGIGIMDSTIFSRVPNDQTFRWFDGGTGFNQNPTNSVNGRTLATLNSGGLNLVTGVFTGNGSGLTNISASALPNNFNYLGINGSNVIEFGRGATKSQDNGNIGYGTYSAGAALDIVGAGTSQATRRIHLHTQGGLTVLGPTTIVGSMNVEGTISQNGHRPWLSSFTNHAIGSQDWTTYFRTAVGGSNTQGSFAWYRGGSHTNTERDAGGGTALANLDANGFFTSGSLMANGSLNVSGGLNFGTNFWNIWSGSDLHIARGGGIRATLLANSTGGFTFSSDRNLKQDIQPLTGALAGLLALKPSTYHFKSDPSAPLSMGLIAQDVQEVYPELVGVVDRKAGTLGVTYEGFIPVIIGATQEQQAQIETLQTENAALQDRVSALEAKLEALLQRLP